MIRFHIKHKTKRIALSMTLFTLFLGTLQPVLAESNYWKTHTVNAAKSDLQFLDSDMSEYVMKWEDTFSALSLATNLSIDSLVKINYIKPIGLIEQDTLLYFNVGKVGAIETLEMEDSQSDNSMSNHQNDLKNQEQMQNATDSRDITDEMDISVIETTVNNDVRTPVSYTLNQFLFQGVIHWSGYKFTYYSQSVLPGGGLNIPGRHVNADGYVVDGEGYIVLANNAPIGTIIETPFGAKGKVYDRGTYGNHFDVYVR